MKLRDRLSLKVNVLCTVEQFEQGQAWKLLFYLARCSEWQIRPDLHAVLEA